MWSYGEEYVFSDHHFSPIFGRAHSPSRLASVLSLPHPCLRGLLLLPPPQPGLLPLPWTAHAAWLPSHPPPITSPYPQVLILGVQISNFSFKLLSQSEGPCPGHLSPSPPCPCLAPMSQSSAIHQVLVSSAVSVLPLSNLTLHFPGPCPHFLCCLHNPSASTPSIISFLTLQSQFPYQTSPRQCGQRIQSSQRTLPKFLKSQGKPWEECQRKSSKRSSRDLV